MRHSSVRYVSAFVALALVVTACGKDRTATPASSAVTTTAPSAPATGGGGTTPVTDTVPAGPTFGDAAWPCSKGDGANSDTGTEPGVTKDSIAIAGGDDAGFTGSPGLNHEITQAMKALVAKCNELGGINGRQITFNYYDAKIFDVATAMQAACDAKNFFLVGEGWAFDGNQEEIRLGCHLPAVPAYTVSAAFAHAADVYQGVPNPSDETPAGVFEQVATLFPDAVKHVATLSGNFGATIETRDKVVAVAPQFGWGFSETTLESNAAGEPDWTPFVKQVKDSGATMVSWQGTCLPGLQLFAQAAKANALDVPIITDANHYTEQCAAANTDGAMNKVYLRMGFIPFEEASLNKATQDYIDLMKASSGDTALLGMQATSSFLLWATASQKCGASLTRQCVLDNMKATHSWTGHGLHAETDPGGNHPPKCSILLQLVGTEYKRVAPTKPGTFECKDTWIAKVSSTPALIAAKLDANRVSQQFTGK
jgi:ABC-type branched-subunit amino acid transport system substrate-binding protein